MRSIVQIFEVKKIIRPHHWNLDKELLSIKNNNKKIWKKEDYGGVVCESLYSPVFFSINYYDMPERRHIYFNIIRFYRKNHRYMNL